MCLLVRRGTGNSDNHGLELAVIFSVSHKHTCSTLMMKQQGILASVWVSHHLWQLLLSLTTLSAQEVISELDYHHQPYSAVRNTHTHTQSIWAQTDVCTIIHTFSNTTTYLSWHTKKLRAQMYSLTHFLTLQNPSLSCITMLIMA